MFGGGATAAARTAPVETNTGGGAIAAACGTAMSTITVVALADELAPITIAAEMACLRFMTATRMCILAATSSFFFGKNQGS